MIKFYNPQNTRYYYIDFQKDLLDDFVLAIYKGSSRCNRGVRRMFFPDSSALSAKVGQLCDRRIKRGYVLV